MRLGGVDKAWLVRDGVPQVLRWRTHFAPKVGAVLVSANGDASRLVQAGFDVVADHVADAGPLAGLDALARACRTPWLLTVPVDLADASDGLLDVLLARRGPDGAHAIDDDGMQPLVALWRTAALREAAGATLDAGKHAVHGLHALLHQPGVRFDGVRFGNLNTPADLAALGATMPAP
ncbi:molybdenum cofactor guanylyltransferase [Luteimonas aestuarii]|uniref:Molybdenum cofactor guanylyltransferase n=2 Tax=Luteimonas aestuarii TaxID=453837 RepID=A0A4R5TS14_9GAMM|nr:molybdenum cofactor guanylyltransferase [Luteimonas aestuarii]